MSRPHTCILVLLVFAGCGPREVVIRHVPAMPDIAYYDGVGFHSTDGMNTYDMIVMELARASADIAIVQPNGTSIGARDLSTEQLERHHVKCSITNNDGQGNFWMRADGGLDAQFSSHRPSWITVSGSSTERSRFSIVLRGHTISLPIKRNDLESMLGEPDEVKLGRRGR